MLGSLSPAWQRRTSLPTRRSATLRRTCSGGSESIVDFVAADWGTVLARRAQKSPPGQGGWQMFHTTLSGTDCTNPATYPQIRANGDGAWFGWPNIPQVETEVTAWFEAKSLDEEKAAARRLNKAALENVVSVPLGLFLQYQAWRQNVSGIVKGPLPFFWGVSKGI